MKMKFENLLPCTYLHSDSVATHMIHSNVYSAMRILVASSLRMGCRLGDGDEYSQRCEVSRTKPLIPNRSPIHPIERLSGSERLRRSTAKNLLALLYIADFWRSIAELWQPLWFGLFSHLAFPMVTEWCCFCHWWYDWDKSWPPPTQFQLPARSRRLIVPARSVCEAMWAFETGFVGLSHRGGVVGISHRGCIVGTSHIGGVMGTNIVGASHRSGAGVRNANCNVSVDATQHGLL